jgi:uncharacterized protein YqgV (UPF0045/DUF77 family)
MRIARLEFLVEPFVVNAPGQHVTAVIDTVEAAGLAPDMGPFAVVANGDLETVIVTVEKLLRSGFSNGATSIQLRVEVNGPEVSNDG